MSDVSQNPGEQGGSQPASSPPKGTSPLRLVLLLLIFGIALAGLLYDYTIARPSIKKADKIIQGLLDGSQKDPDGDGSVTPTEVQSLLGCKPSAVRQLTNGMIETYSWRSGLPYRTYKLYVVYAGQKMPLLHSATTNEEPPADQLPQATQIEKTTQEQIDNFKPGKPIAASAGGGPPKAKKGGGGKKRGGGMGGARGMKAPMEEEDAQAPADAGDAGESEPAKEVPAKEEPAKETPPPTAEPAKETPPPTAEPAKETPPPTAEPAKETPPPTEEPKKSDGGEQ